MKNIKDKIVSAICAAAICAPAAVIPAAAETTNTWKFDFGAGTPADGYLAVSADMVYDMSDTESFQYGFLGTTETSYADDVLGYTFDQRAIDGYTVSKGQYITLAEGGTQSDSDPDTDYIAVPKKADYMPEGASEYEGRYPLRFSVKAENGGYYTVTVTLANSSDTEEARVSLYSEKRHIIAQDAVLEPGERAEFTFNVDIENVFYKDYSKSYPDDILNISVVGENAAISSMIVEEHAKVDGTINGTSAQVNDGVTLWACDDSTGCDCPSTIPVFPLQNYAGVAQALSKYMPESIAVSNQGERGLASGDNAHFNNCLLKEGDYLYVEYGHNESSGDSYKSNLEKYYTRAHEAGAKLIIVSPVERHNKWSDGSWQSSLSGYAEKGSEFVEEKIAAGADDIAFVDLNTRYLAWMNEETARIGAINSDVAGQSAICYYYQSAKGESVDGTHVNDAGADQAAYCFFEEAADTVAAAAQDDASESTKLQAAVLEPIVSGMKTKIGSTDADNLPLTVSDEIILAGSAPNSYWDTPVKDSVTYTNSAAVCGTDYTQNEDGSRTLSGISIRLMNTLVYAKAVVTVESDGESTVYYSESNFDCTGDATGSVKTISGFISSDKDHTAVTDADKVPEITIPAGAKCTIEIVSCDDNWVVGSDFVSYSTKYTLPDVDKDILTEDFSDVSDWTYSGGVGYHSETVKTDSDNTSYLAIESSGVGTDGTTKKNYAFYRALDEGVSDGVLRISLKARYSAGMIRFALANEVSTSASNPLPVKAYTAWLYNSKAYSISDDYGVTTSVDTSNPYLINAGEWLDIDCIYDIDNGKEYLSVGGSDYLVTEISELSQNEVPSTLPFNYFAIAGDSQGTGLYADIKDLTVSKLNADELADIAVSASANDSSMGSVTINGEAVSETTVKMNSSVTLRAKAADEDHTFVNWTDENGEETSTLSSLTISRVHNPVSLTANFRALEADEPRTKTWDFSEFTDDTASTGETTTDYDGLEIHTNSGDTVGLSGVYWSAPGGTKSNSTTVVSNNRYIKYTAPKDGQMTITYKGSENTSKNHPRMYVSCGSDTSCMTKEASSGQSEANQQYDNNAADTLATMTVSLTGGMTYYIWGYFYNNTSCAFTITNVTYTADVSSEPTATASPEATATASPEPTPSAAPSTEVTPEPSEDPLNMHWDFSEFTDDTASTGETTTDYDGLEIHTNSGDTVGLSGVYWSAPGGTKSNSTTVVSNNRYIKYTAPKDGQMTITYKGSENTSKNHPRMYVSCGSDTSCMTKEASSGQSEANQQYDNNAADTLATMTVSLTGGMTYYIWGYFYNNTSCAFTITDMTYTADTAQMTTRNIYESNMLLQRDKPVYIDGTCTTVVKEATAQLINETSGETVQTKAVDIDGKEWSLTFDPVSDYTNTYTLRISSDGMDDLVYTNIIFGDQYLFSGQSNMWKSVVYYRSKDSDYAQATVEEHLSDKIRVMYSKGSSCYGKTDPCYDEPYKSSWRDFSTYSNVSELPAVAFTAAVQLYENTGVPIGVIANAYPGSYISCWFPNTGIDACNSNKNGNSNERNWYNGRIYPIRNLKLSGIFWYQGEADSSDAYHSPQYDYYKEMMTQLINDWRELFGDDTLPFYYVQLCRLGQTVDENNSDTTSDGEIFIRRAQTDVYVEAEDKTNIGIVGTLDIYGNYTYSETSNDANCRNDIHPAQKRLIGERLAAYALKDIYGKDVDTHGPIYQSVKSEGGSLVITYDCTGKLSVMPSESYGDEVSAQKIENGEYDPNVLNEFEVAGADGVWYAADAEITSDNQVTVHSDSVPKPISVRYAYSSYPESPNLTDDTGLPSYVFMSECEIGDITYADNTLTIPADLTAVSGIDADVYVAEYSSDGTLAAVKKAELAEDGTTISYSLKDESNTLAVMIWDNNMLSFTQKAIMQ